MSIPCLFRLVTLIAPVNVPPSRAFTVTGMECVRQLFKSGVRDVDEVAERCGLTRETARKYLARVRRESEAKTGDILADVEKTKRAIELVKRGEVSDPADLVLRLDITLQDAERLFSEIVKAVGGNLYVRGLEAAKRIVERAAEAVRRGTPFEEVDLDRIAGEVRRELGLPGDRAIAEALRAFIEALDRLVHEVVRLEDEAAHELEIYEFIENPRRFYYEVMKIAESRRLKDFEPALFTVPCSVCGKPMVFTHGDEDWPRVRAVLREAFRDWAHVECLRESTRKPLQSFGQM